MSRDPRFLPINSSNNHSHEQDYAFLKDMQKEELQELNLKLKEKYLTEEERFEIQRDISKMTTIMKREERKEQIQQIKHEFYEKEKQLIAEKGKKPFFIKDCKFMTKFRF